MSRGTSGSADDSSFAANCSRSAAKSRRTRACHPQPAPDQSPRVQRLLRRARPHPGWPTRNLRSYSRSPFVPSPAERRGQAPASTAAAIASALPANRLVAPGAMNTWVAFAPAHSSSRPVSTRSRRRHSRSQRGSTQPASPRSNHRSSMILHPPIPPRNSRRTTLPVVVSGRSREGHLARIFVRREPAAHEGLDVGGQRVGRRVARLQDHERLDDLGAQRIGLADRRGAARRPGGAIRQSSISPGPMR